MIEPTEVMEVITGCLPLTDKVISINRPSYRTIFIDALTEIVVYHSHIKVYPNRYLPGSFSMSDIFEFQEWAVDFFSAY